jgi:hypothetical protein
MAGSISGSWEPEPRLGFAKTSILKLFQFHLGRQRGSEVRRRQMNFGACVVNVSDDRPYQLENGESTDPWLFVTKQTIALLSFSTRALFLLCQSQARFVHLVLIIITHPPTPLIDPAKAGSISGSWEPEPRLGFAKTSILKLFQFHLGRQRGSEVRRRQMNFGACVVNVSDDRPYPLENGESTDPWLFVTTHVGLLVTANVANKSVALLSFSTRALFLLCQSQVRFVHLVLIIIIQWPPT